MHSNFHLFSLVFRDYSACWTYKHVPDPLNGRTKEKEIHMKIVQAQENEMKIRAQQVRTNFSIVLGDGMKILWNVFTFVFFQLHKRLSECVKALHILEELNMGVLGGRGDKASTIVTGEHFNWKQFQVRTNLCVILDEAKVPVVLLNFHILLF